MADPKWSSVSSSSSPSCAHSSGNALILFLLVDHVGEDGICTGSAIGKSMLCRTEYNYAAQARTGRSSAFDPAEQRLGECQLCTFKRSECCCNCKHDRDAEVAVQGRL